MGTATPANYVGYRWPFSRVDVPFRGPLLNPNLPDIYAGAKPALKLGLCQVHTEAWDVTGNVERTFAALERAADDGAEFAITPECVFHGYGFGDNQADSARRLIDVAETVDDERLRSVRALARRRTMGVVIGFVEQAGGGVFHNSAAVISPQGDVLGVYRKVHCRNFEDIGFTGCYTPGDRFLATDVNVASGLFRLGTMICFDREIPESVRCLRAMGSQLIACPLACDTAELSHHVNYAHNESITQTRATENELFIAVVNHAGSFNGGSFVVGPGGETIVQLGAEADVRVVDIPVTDIATTIHGRPYSWMGWGYRRPDVYAQHMPS